MHPDKGTVYSQKVIKAMAEPRSNADCGDCGLSTLAKVVRMVKLRQQTDMFQEIHEERGHKYCFSTAMLFWAEQSFAQHTVRSVVCVIHGHVSKEQLNPENSSLLRAAGLPGVPAS